MRVGPSLPMWHGVGTAVLTGRGDRVGGLPDRAWARGVETLGSPKPLWGAPFAVTVRADAL